ncbi:MAG: S8 family serine peptidase [Caldilineaceae bacterium]
MKKRYTSLAWFVMVGASALASLWFIRPGFAQSAQPAQAHLVWQLPGDPSAYKDTPFAPGEILVGFHRDQVRAAALLTELNAQLVQPLDLRGLDGATGDAGVEGQLLRVPEGTEWAAIAKLTQDPTVAFAVPNWIVRAVDANTADVVAQPETAYNPNDIYYADRQWYLQRINASRAWALAESSAGFAGQLTTVRVATVDSGIDFNHTELKSLINGGYNYISKGATKPQDDYGHGTHVAGLLGAIINNGAGIAGVAPAVEFVPYKVLSSTGTGTIADVSAAIQAAADNKARIINMSLETSSPNVVMEAAVKYAYNKGALLVAASGNGYPAPVSWPAAYDQVMAVAATTYANHHASYSNAGTQVAIAAPGGDSANSMLSTWPSTVRCRDLVVITGYCTSEGTSMAAAVVSGAAALVMGVRPDLTADQVRQLLRSTAAPVSGEDATRVGSGLLDLHAALRKLLPNTIHVSTPDNVTRNLVSGAAPYTVTIRIENPSLESMNWQAKLLGNNQWVRLTDTLSNTVSGTVLYGEPAHVSLLITPTHLITDGYVTNLQVVGTRADKSVVAQTVGISLYVGVKPYLYHFPLAFQNAAFANDSSTSTYHWEIPANSADRTTYNVVDNSEATVSLPFTFTMRSKAYTLAQIFDDGYVILGSGAGATASNACLPNLSDPQQAIYGWWANLNPGIAGGKVSTFRPATDRFVIEFDNVSAAAGVTPRYRVSFQIVLYTNGNIRLNYQQVPERQTAPPNVTIGLETTDGRFYNQVACKDATTELGILPGQNQSLLFNPQEDVY